MSTLNILIIDSDPAVINTPKRAQYGETTGEGYATALSACRPDIKIKIICPYDGVTLPDLAEFDGAVFTGSAVEWSTDDTRAEPLAGVMRACFARGIPSLGSCNGMQLAASVLGGASQPSPNGNEDGLATGITRTDAGRNHPFLTGRVDGYSAPCVHRDEVTRLPEGAVVLAGNDHSAVQAFAYEKNGVRFWGVQYHPEYTLPYIGKGLLDWGRLPAEIADDVALADTEPAAARRLGVRIQDLQPEMRTSEIRNWLQSL